jgi:PAS domain S-box-containing protein
MEFDRPEWVTQMEGVLETLNEGVLIVDDCDRVVFANECMAQMIGCPREEVVGQNSRRYYRPEEARAAHGAATGSREERGERFEYLLPQCSGGRLPVVVSSSVIEDPDGREFSVVTFTDITEQKRAEQQLKEANEQLRRHAEEIEAELRLASRVQQSLAPKSLRWGRAVVESEYLPVHTIGGDFGLVSPASDGQLNLLVCDVSGHGISAALVANRIYAETISLLDRGADVGELLHALNQFVVRQIGLPGFYFTMAVARLSGDGRTLRFASAGHPPGFWLSGGECRRLEPGGTILGLLENPLPREVAREIPVASGDRVVLYTDGLLEVWNRAGEELGVEGLEDIVRRHAARPAAELKQSILREIEAWRQGPPTDDISLVVVEML